MNLKIWRWVTLVLAALTMGMTFAHTLETLPKLQWDAELYRTVQTSLYPFFGTVGPVVEVGLVISASLLTYLIRGNKRVFPYSLAGMIAILVSLVLWFVVVRPASVEIGAWQTVPADWMRWRDQWQFGQVTAFVLHLIGFGALAYSVIAETPES